MEFEWDDEKNERNRTKHGLRFDDVIDLFRRGDFLEIYDFEHAGDEDRFIAIGLVRAGVIVVVYSERSENVMRIISARRATRQEIRRYEQYLETRP